VANFPLLNRVPVLANEHLTIEESYTDREYEYQPIELDTKAIRDADGKEIRPALTDEAVKYIEQLYDRTIPCISDPHKFPSSLCLVWTGAKDVCSKHTHVRECEMNKCRGRYARHKVPENLKSFSKSELVHRFLYECAHGTIGTSIHGEEKTVDHACSRTDCINLRHLRLLPRSMNIELGDHRKLYERNVLLD